MELNFQKYHLVVESNCNTRHVGFSQTVAVNDKTILDINK